MRHEIAQGYGEGYLILQLHLWSPFQFLLDLQGYSFDIHTRNMSDSSPEEEVALEVKQDCSAPIWRLSWDVGE
ncbi:hypothetical protein Y1Q_0014638 [Alligator mississippiensis]|uniref:Uncharacterized protein n=1 Tax=Alligator mississippiensis TaxID=8496 RepID=A0A151P864_ALLMI|nr:hypothetical protein Y1Q_0014638 [Alligator mississippiensis]